MSLGTHPLGTLPLGTAPSAGGGGGGTAYFKSLAGSIAPSSLTYKGTKQTGLGGSTSPSGSLSSRFVIVRSVGGSLTPSGAIAKLPRKVLSGSMTVTGSTTKKSTKKLLGSITPSASLVKKIKRALQGTITPTAAYISRFRTTHALSGSVSPSGSVNGVWSAAPAGGTTRNIVKHLMRMVGK